MHLGFKEAAGLLNETLEEEKKTDTLLSQIAETVNAEADEDEEGDEDEEEEEEETKPQAARRKSRGR